MNRASKLLIVGIASLMLVSCSSSGSSGKSDDKKTTKTATTVKAAGKQADVAPVTGQIDRTPSPKGTGIIKTTKMASCDTKPGAVKAVGTVELPAGMGPARVVVSVAWVNSKTGTVFSRSSVTLDDVRAGQATDWETTNVLPDNGVPVRCVLGAVAAD